MFLGNFLWMECGFKLEKRNFKDSYIKSQIAAIYSLLSHHMCLLKSNESIKLFQSSPQPQEN